MMIIPKFVERLGTNEIYTETGDYVGCVPDDTYRQHICDMTSFDIDEAEGNKEFFEGCSDEGIESVEDLHKMLEDKEEADSNLDGLEKNVEVCALELKELFATVELSPTVEEELKTIIASLELEHEQRYTPKFSNIRFKDKKHFEDWLKKHTEEVIYLHLNKHDLVKLHIHASGEVLHSNVDQRVWNGLFLDKSLGLLHPGEHLIFRDIHSEKLVYKDLIVSQKRKP